MTEPLTRLLHEQAELAHLAPVDLDAVMVGGARSLRRRRRARYAAAVVAAVAAVLVAGAANVLRPDASGPEPAPPPVDSGSTALTWARGSTLHTLDGDVEVGHPITAFARSSIGYLVASGNEVYSVVDGEVELLDKVGPDPYLAPRLFGDTDGTLVGWRTSTHRANYQVRDQTGSSSMGGNGGRPGGLLDVDHTSVYLLQDGVVTSTSMLTGEQVAVEGRPSAFEDGTFSYPGDFGVPAAKVSREVLSPQADWAALDKPEARVFGLATGFELPLGLSDYHATIIDWTDDDTLALRAVRPGETQVQLLDCEVRTGECTVAVPDLDADAVFATGLPAP